VYTGAGIRCTRVSVLLISYPMSAARDQTAIALTTLLSDALLLPTFVGGAPDSNDRDLAPFDVLFRITLRADGKSKGVRFVLDKPRRGKGYHVESSNRIMTDWVKPGGY
jgi:hypothetical protein